MEVNLNINNATKLRVLGKAARDSGIFKRRFLDAYEDSGTGKTWATQVPLFEAEYSKIVRAAGRADEDPDYESAAALREQLRRADAQ